MLSGFFHLGVKEITSPAEILWGMWLDGGAALIIPVLESPVSQVTANTPTQIGEFHSNMKTSLDSPHQALEDNELRISIETEKVESMAIQWRDEGREGVVHHGSQPVK